MRVNTIMRYFFWGAYAVFLFASIPHVAYFFKAAEPDGAWFWLVAYAIAISIDITVFLLSLTIAELQRRNISSWVTRSVWVFVIALAGLSWFMNWQYALQFQGNMLNKAMQFQVIAIINPWVASCFQILAIAYTWISDKLTYSTVQEIAHPENSVQDHAITELHEMQKKLQAEITKLHEITRKEDPPQETAPLQIVSSPPKSDEEILQFMALHPAMKQKEIAEKLQIDPSKLSRIKLRYKKAG